MVFVVGDEESHYFLLLVVLTLYVRQLQTAILVPVVSLDSGLALIFKHGVDYLHSVGNGEADAVALLPSLGVERTCAEEYAYHVEGARLWCVCLPHMGAVLLLAVLLHVYLAVGIAIESLVDGVAVGLACSLAEVERLKLGGVVAQQRVAHAEELVGTFRRACDERRSICRLAMIPALYGRHRRVAHLHPHKLPVEVEVVSEKLARLESRVLELALCLRRAYAHDNQGYSEYKFSNFHK